MVFYLLCVDFYAILTVQVHGRLVLLGFLRVVWRDWSVACTDFILNLVGSVPGSKVVSMPSDNLKYIDQYLDISLTPQEKPILTICLSDLFLNLIPYLCLNQPHNKFLVIYDTFWNDKILDGFLISDSLESLS